ncbi:MAG: hypothetical protein DMG50_29345 [Acidobacteria bacterium]|nr:MAG: hypothetical protein DMG50_29345 [Acidobacteriota bacterium]
MIGRWLAQYALVACSVIPHLIFPASPIGEDFNAYTDYCFGKTGQLLSLRFELRTAWGWGFREEGPIVNGILRPRTSEFFNTKDELAVTKPEQADDVPEALRPHLYARRSRLPFAKLLSK